MFGNGSVVRQIEHVNRELLLILSVFIVAGLLNFLVESQRMILGFYTLPTLGAAYLYGRRQATLTAFASVLLVILMASVDPTLLFESTQRPETRWLEVMIWGGTLMLTGYLMGTLYDHKNDQIREIRATYDGILVILRHFISKDKYTENHSYRVSVYAARIAESLGFNVERIEDVRAAALLHDIGKLEISRELLYKAARLTEAEVSEMKQHVAKGVQLLEPVGGTLRRVIPIVLAHHDKFDGSGHHPDKGEQIPIEARILSVADVYDSLTSDRPYLKAMPPLEVRDMIAKGAGTDFDPKVVDAFAIAFQRGEMEVPSVVL